MPADLYVNDAFGAAHRAHASTEGVARLLPAAAGFLMAKELAMLGQALDEPRRPFAAIMGGAKVSDKIAVLESLAGKVDKLIIGGGMAATFFKAVWPAQWATRWWRTSGCRSHATFIGRAAGSGLELRLPTDVAIADGFAQDAATRVVGVGAIPDGWRVMDVGPQTAAGVRGRGVRLRHGALERADGRVRVARTSPRAPSAWPRRSRGLDVTPRPSWAAARPRRRCSRWGTPTP